MNTVIFDGPILVIGIVSLLWMRFHRSATVFQVACQFFGTFLAQYSFIVAWSLGKIVPILSCTSVPRQRVKFAVLFMPFVGYVLISGLILSNFFKIPSGVAFAYGAGRIWVQLFVFATMVMSSRALAAGLLHEHGGIILWKGLTVAALVHGIASLYQYLAIAAGLPLIGISRSHGETIDGGVGDVAAFDFGGITDIYRPGGLAGEPKTVAVIFGIYLFCQILSGWPPGASVRWKQLAKCAVAMSLVCFVGAFATSAFLGAAMCAVVLVPFFANSRRNLTKLVKYFVLSVVALAIAFVGVKYLLNINFFDIIMLRTIGRIGEGGVDAPIEAALHIIASSPMVLFFGTGIGGGSFEIMSYLKTVYQYALAPNVNMVLMLLEFGAVGTLLLLVPFCILSLRVGAVIRDSRRSGGSSVRSWSVKLMFVAGVSTMCLMVSGSGIPMGFSLSVGCMLAAAQLATQRTRMGS